MRLFFRLTMCVFIAAVSAPLFAQQLRERPDTLYFEAESFAEKGGWGIDTQSVDLVGSPYLIAHGWGTPVADAKTTAEFPKAGTYRVFARTRNWVAPWTPEYAPGRFQIAVDGKPLSTEFGTNGVDWSWQEGGTVEISADRLKVELALQICEFERYVFFNTHFPLSAELRLAAAKTVNAEALKYEKPIILVGDLNAEPDSEEILELKKTWTQVSPERPTFPAPEPTVQIDYVFVRNVAKVTTLEACVVEDPSTSDHRPVLCSIEME